MALFELAHGMHAVAQDHRRADLEQVDDVVYLVGKKQRLLRGERIHGDLEPGHGYSSLRPAQLPPARFVNILIPSSLSVKTGGRGRRTLQFDAGRRARGELYCESARWC